MSWGCRRSAAPSRCRRRGRPALSFSLGAVLPVLAIGLTPSGIRAVLCVVVTLAALALRVLVWGAVAMAITSGIGALVGSAV
jgi:vacuolar iron transporter family protein